MQYLITLKCFSCGKTKDVLVDNRPAFAYEIVDITNKSGMYGVIDLLNKRALVFCNDVCANNQKTKKNTYRIRPIII